MNHSIMRLYYSNLTKNIHSMLILLKYLLWFILNLNISGSSGAYCSYLGSRDTSKLHHTGSFLLDDTFNPLPLLYQWIFQTLKSKLGLQDLTQWREKWLVRTSAPNCKVHIFSCVSGGLYFLSSLLRWEERDEEFQVDLDTVDCSEDGDRLSVAI